MSFPVAGLNPLRSFLVFTQNLPKPENQQVLTRGQSRPDSVVQRYHQELNSDVLDLISFGVPTDGQNVHGIWPPWVSEISYFIGCGSCKVNEKP